MSETIHMCKCGHGQTAHYNARRLNGEDRRGNQPCHHLGKHDMRCPCKNFAEVFAGTPEEWARVKVLVIRTRSGWRAVTPAFPECEGMGATKDDAAAMLLREVARVVSA